MAERMVPRMMVFILVLVVGLVCLTIFLAIVFIKSKTTTNGTIFANRKECAQIGGKMLKMNGSFADAAIAMLFCESVHQPQKLGIGGGFLALIYVKSNPNAMALIAQEIAPLAAKENMFKNRSSKGELAIAVPGQVKGYYALHRKYGRLKWADLLNPAIKLCESGHIVNRELANDLKTREDEIRKISSFREIFINPSTNKTYEKGQLIRYIRLAETLKVIAREGQDTIYNGGKIGKLLIQDIRSFGGILTDQDLLQYRHKWRKPIATKFLNYTVYSMPVSGSGILLSVILQKAQHDKPDKDPFGKTGGKHVHISSQKGLKRYKKEEQKKSMIAKQLANVKLSNLSRVRFQDSKTLNILEQYSEKEMTSVHGQVVVHVAVLTPTGDAIIVSSTIHSRFGAMRLSSHTGIILNDEMKHFSGPNQTNIPKSRTYLLSTMCPVIIVDMNGFPKLFTSSVGGSNATLALAKLIVENLQTKRKRKRSVYKLADIT
ncbi:unnamed protein product [Hermetia illucens]|uniref:Uncharacterized protein n=1 Tax=Hermetia illucens TaxID=343691 RepID=A0A7R8V271_HERIL|nr:scoloptoxin SSD14-like isoform X2 [Hermetia illucens]CAD7090855.1 unnamed protein product [Hermetia illucens]